MEKYMILVWPSDWSPERKPHLLLNFAAPEYANTGLFKEKSDDIYSYGFLLLEKLSPVEAQWTMAVQQTSDCGNRKTITESMKIESMNEAMSVSAETETGPVQSGTVSRN